MEKYEKEFLHHTLYSDILSRHDSCSYYKCTQICPVLDCVIHITYTLLRTELVLGMKTHNAYLLLASKRHLFRPSNHNCKADLDLGWAVR